ncbi:hypothetical protein MKX01_034680 [Papaver californicum]|nr:hypothetical protein MKX01_034680 [Papaver californicum]
MVNYPQNDGSIIIIFGRGIPAVTRQEIRDYFSSNFGADSVKSIRAREFARVVFRSMSTIEFVLNGQEYVLLVINGKLASARAHVRDPRPVGAGSSPPAPATPDPNE